MIAFLNTLLRRMGRLYDRLAGTEGMFTPAHRFNRQPLQFIQRHDTCADCGTTIGDILDEPNNTVCAVNAAREASYWKNQT